MLHDIGNGYIKETYEDVLLQVALRVYGPPQGFVLGELDIRESNFFEANLYWPKEKPFPIMMTIPKRICNQGEERKASFVMHVINDHLMLRPGQPLNFIFFIKNKELLKSFQNPSESLQEEIAGRECKVFEHVISEWIDRNLGRTPRETEPERK